MLILLKKYQVEQTYPQSGCGGKKTSVWQRSEVCREGLPNSCFCAVGYLFFVFLISQKTIVGVVFFRLCIMYCS